MKREKDSAIGSLEFLNIVKFCIKYDTEAEIASLRNTILHVDWSLHITSPCFKVNKLSYRWQTAWRIFAICTGMA